MVDQFAVYKNGNPIDVDAQTPFRSRAVPTMSAVPETTTSEKKRARVYGWDRVMWLVKCEPEKVRRTPEAYKFIAMAVYYIQTNKYGLQLSYGYTLNYGEQPFVP